MNHYSLVEKYCLLISSAYFTAEIITIIHIISWLSNSKSFPPPT